MTSFEEGQQDGAKIHLDPSVSPTEFLAQMERVYREEVAALSQLSPEYAARQSEYLEGWIAGIRASIKSTMARPA